MHHQFDQIIVLVHVWSRIMDTTLHCIVYSTHHNVHTYSYIRAHIQHITLQVHLRSSNANLLVQVLGNFTSTNYAILSQFPRTHLADVSVVRKLVV